MKTKIITSRMAFFAIFTLIFNFLFASYCEAGEQLEKRNGLFARIAENSQQRKLDRHQTPAPLLRQQAAKHSVASSITHPSCNPSCVKTRVVERERIVYKDVIKEIEVEVPVYKTVPRVIEVDLPVYKPVPRKILVDIPVYKPVPRVIEIDIPVYKPVVQEICVNIPVYRPHVVEIPVQMHVYQPQVVQRKMVYQPPPQQTYRSSCYQQHYRGPSGPPLRHYDRGRYISRGHSGPSFNQGVVFGNNYQHGSGGNTFNMGTFGGNRSNPNAGLAHAAINQALGGIYLR